VAGELQSFAISPSYGGPTPHHRTREKYLRQMPGRLVARPPTRGKRAFCLTLSTREQHIAREATSNIAPTRRSSPHGDGLMTSTAKRTARAGLTKPRQGALLQQIEAPFSGKFFNEFVVRPKQIARGDQQSVAQEKDYRGCRWAILPELADSILLCATEMTKRADMDASPSARMIKRSRNTSRKTKRSSSSAVRGKKAYQLPSSMFRGGPSEALGAENVRQKCRLPRSQRSGGHPPLHRLST